MASSLKGRGAMNADQVRCPGDFHEGLWGDGTIMGVKASCSLERVHKSQLPFYQLVHESTNS